MKHTLLSPKIKAWRTKRKLSQRQAAFVLGVNQRTLEGWEYGRTMPEGIGLSALLKRLGK